MSQQTCHPENSTDGVEQSVSEEQAISGDLELARKIAINLPGALESLIEQHGEHLQRLIRSLNGGNSSADDLMQETLLKAWEAAGQYRGDAPLRHWLTQIAVRVCRNHQRSYRRLMGHLRSFWQQRTDQSIDGLAGDGPRDDAMLRAISRLPYADREILVLYYFEEQPLSHVAAQIGIRESTLYVRLHRSRERLKVLLQQVENKP